MGGYSDRSSGEAETGALMLGVHEADGSLRYVGNVGTGWDAKTVAGLKKQLAKMEVPASPFGHKPLGRSRWSTRGAAPRWVQPRLNQPSSWPSPGSRSDQRASSKCALQ